MIVTCNNPWTDQYNGSLIAAAPVTGNTGTGIVFPDYNGSDVTISPGGNSYMYPGSATITLSKPIALNSSAVVIR